MDGDSIKRESFARETLYGLEEVVRVYKTQINKYKPYQIFAETMHRDRSGRSDLQVLTKLVVKLPPFIVPLPFIHPGYITDGVRIRQYRYPLYLESGKRRTGLQGVKMIRIPGFFALMSVKVEKRYDGALSTLKLLSEVSPEESS